MAGHDCKYYLSQASADATKVDTICAANAFNILAQLKPFLAPAYFQGNTTYGQILKNMTLLTDAELASLYNISNTESLGSLISQQQQIIHNFYQCKAFANNCTADEIASMQWGSSHITKDFFLDYKKTPFLSKTGLSVTDVWGLFKYEPEYYFYANQNLKDDELFMIEPLSVGKILNNVTGLLDQTKTAIFVINVTKGINLIDYERKLGIPNVQAFLKGMRFMI